MKGAYLNCYTLGQTAPSQEQLHYVLPCDSVKALQLFALHINEKGVLLPQQRLVPLAVPHTQLSVCRLSSRHIATFLWRTGQLSQSTNPVIRFLESIHYERQLFRHLQRKEETLDELVLELFYSSQGHTPRVNLPTPAAAPADLLLARLHFSSVAADQTMLRIFIGWTDDAPLAALDELYHLLNHYLALLHQVLLPQSARPGSTTNQLDDMKVGKPARQSNDTAAGAKRDRTTDVADQRRGPTVVPPQPQPLSSEWQVRETAGQDLLHDEQGFLTMKERGEAFVANSSEETAVPPTEKFDAVAPASPTVPLPSEDERLLYRGMKPPRLYPKTLSNICIMVAERQQQIDAWGKIPGLETFAKPLRPSRNTLRKIPELVTHWHDIHYRWNVVSWLQHHSGHSDREISELLSYLQHHLAERVWAVVTSGGKVSGNTRRNHRHHAQMEKKSRKESQAEMAL